MFGPRLRVCGLVIAFLVASMGNAWGWSLDLRAMGFSFDYNSLSQTGANGFFGPYNVDNSTTGNYAPLNGWLGQTIVSGSNSGMSSIYYMVIPSVEITPAVRVGGAYRIGSYETASRPGATTSISSGEWTRLGIFVRTPFAVLTYGKLRFAVGSGLQYALGNHTEEFFLIRSRVPSVVTNAQLLFQDTGKSPDEFGQLTPKEQLELAGWSGEGIVDEKVRDRLRELRTWASNPNHTATTVPAATPWEFAIGVYPWRRGETNYWSRDDLSGARTANLFAGVSYTAGSIDADVGGFYTMYHEGPEAQQTVLDRHSAPTVDTDITDGYISFKFNNGRLFFAAEADWYYSTIRYQRSQNGTFRGQAAVDPPGSGSLFAPRYRESWRYMTQFGIFEGPFIVTCLYAHMPGPDRRHGILIDRQPWVSDRQLSGAAVFRPFSTILSQAFNAGVNSFAEMTDANTFAARLDYALASNLNIFGSVLHARRVSHGYGWGYVRPYTNETPAETYGTVVYRRVGSFLNPAPAIPDNDLGWELNLGVSWGLLESWQLDLLFSYWKPGRWFNYACIDKSVTNWNVPTAANNFGANPNRTIDPITGITMSFSVGF